MHSVCSSFINKRAVKSLILLSTDSGVGIAPHAWCLLAHAVLNNHVLCQPFLWFQVTLKKISTSLHKSEIFYNLHCLKLYYLFHSSPLMLIILVHWWRYMNGCCLKVFSIGQQHWLGLGDSRNTESWDIPQTFWSNLHFK